MGARRKANGEGKGGSRRKGKSRGDREEGGGQHLLPHFSSFRTGAAHAAPVSFRFERGGMCCPVSFHFERGQRMLPPFLFVNSGTYPPPSFWGEDSSRGVNDDNRAACHLRAALFDLVYPPVVGGISCGDDNDNEAVCNLHTALVFFLFPPGVDEDNGVA
jgi:hypothetical protein